MGFECGASDSHYEAEVRDQTVVCTQYGSAQCVSTHASVSAFKARKHASTQGLRRGARQGFDHARMRTFRRRQSVGHGFRLTIVLAAVNLLKRIDCRQHERGPKPRASHSSPRVTKPGRKVGRA